MILHLISNLISGVQKGGYYSKEFYAAGGSPDYPFRHKTEMHTDSCWSEEREYIIDNRFRAIPDYA